MSKLELFIRKYTGFEELKSSEQVDYFAYFLLIECKNDGFTAKEIQSCFEELHLNPYSNIPSYLSRNLKGKPKKFLKKKNKYYLERVFKLKLDEVIGKTPMLTEVQSDLFPVEILDNTRGYLKNIANQALASYNNGIYDGSSVLLRKLIEILIIECFEKHGNEADIKKSDGSFFYLSDLITEFLKESKWNIGRNAKKGLPKIKKIGDLSAHNRRYMARKADIDNVKDELRVVIEELVHLVDYPNWK